MFLFILDFAFTLVLYDYSRLSCRVFRLPFINEHLSHYLCFDIRYRCSLSIVPMVDADGGCQWWMPMVDGDVDDATPFLCFFFCLHRLAGNY